MKSLHRHCKLQSPGNTPDGRRDDKKGGKKRKQTEKRRYRKGRSNKKEGATNFRNSIEIYLLTRIIHRIITISIIQGMSLMMRISLSTRSST